MNETDWARADPADARNFQTNANRETAEIAQLDIWIRAKVATVPARQRAMICFHDAWYYFDRRYGIKNVGSIEVSPGQEPSPGYFARLVGLAKSNGVRVIF